MSARHRLLWLFFFFQAEDGIRDDLVTGVQSVLFRSALVVHGSDDLIVAAMHHQRGDGDLLEVVPEISFRESTDRVIGGEHARRLPLPPVVLPQAFRDLGTRPIEAVVGYGDVEIPLRPVSVDGSAETVEYLLRRPGRIGRGLEQERCHRRNEGDLGDAALAMGPDITRDLAAAHRMTDE